MKILANSDNSREASLRARLDSCIGGLRKLFPDSILSHHGEYYPEEDMLSCIIELVGNDVKGEEGIVKKEISKYGKHLYGYYEEGIYSIDFDII